MRGWLKNVFATRDKSVPRRGAAESRAIFWFNWQEISDSGHPMYGRAVFEVLLPKFAPGEDDFGGRYEFWDGDLLPRQPLSIPKDGPEAEHCLENASECGWDRCYLVAVAGSGPVALSSLDAELSATDLTGYLGMTPFGRLDRMSFEALVDDMGLVRSCMVRGRDFLGWDFSFIGEDDLRAMGFVPQSPR
jgi:hypothetical protein